MGQNTLETTAWSAYSEPRRVMRCIFRISGHNLGAAARYPKPSRPWRISCALGRKHSLQQPCSVPWPDRMLSRIRRGIVAQARAWDMPMDGVTAAVPAEVLPARLPERACRSFSSPADTFWSGGAIATARHPRQFGSNKVKQTERLPRHSVARPF
jgi:hypothetical protein